MWLQPIALICISLSSIFCKHTHMQTLFWSLWSRVSFFFRVWFIFPFTHSAPSFSPHLWSCLFFFLLIYSSADPFLSLTWWVIFIPSPSCRFVPEVVSSGPAGGQPVPQFPVSGEDNEVIQLHAGQQSTSAPYIHARHVVRHTHQKRGFRARFHACRYTDVLSFTLQKAWGRAFVFVHLHTHTLCS